MHNDVEIKFKNQKNDLQKLEKMYSNIDNCVNSKEFLKYFDMDSLNSIFNNTIYKCNKSLPQNNSKAIFLKLSDFDILSTNFLKRVQVFNDNYPLFIKMNQIQYKLSDCIDEFNEMFKKVYKCDHSRKPCSTLNCKLTQVNVKSNNIINTIIIDEKETSTTCNKAYSKSETMNIQP
jgi:hypothetical protein